MFSFLSQWLTGIYEYIRDHNSGLLAEHRQQGDELVEVLMEDSTFSTLDFEVRTVFKYPQSITRQLPRLLAKYATLSATRENIAFTRLIVAEAFYNNRDLLSLYGVVVKPWATALMNLLASMLNGKPCLVVQSGKTFVIISPNAIKLDPMAPSKPNWNIDAEQFNIQARMELFPILFIRGIATEMIH